MVMVGDSTIETKTHIYTVRELFVRFMRNLADRASSHDASKLDDPERSMYDLYTPMLRSTTYGSEQYQGILAEMGPALQHHYEHNSHHPEHFANGINGMSLLDLLEMLADWKAATLRHDDGDLIKSLEINRERFQISDQLYEILENTIIELRWENRDANRTHE